MNKYKLFFWFFLVLMRATSFAQIIPINLQGVAVDRNNYDNLDNLYPGTLNHKFLLIKVEVVLDYDILFAELHTVKTNEFGRFNCDLGLGSNLVGDFMSIDWRKRDIEIRIYVDQTASGDDFNLVSIEKVAAVPLALFSLNSEESGINMSLIEDSLFINGNFVMLNRNLDSSEISFSVPDNYRNKLGTIAYTWDDTQEAHISKIAPIFLQRNLRCSFGVITNPNYDSLLYEYQLLKRQGFDLVSHSHNHVRFALLNTQQQMYELDFSKQRFKYFYGFEPLSFIYPNNASTTFSDSIFTQYYMFNRITYPLFADASKFSAANLSSTPNMYQRLLNIYNATKKDSLKMIVAGHGVDGLGYEPVSSYWLKRHLDQVLMEDSISVLTMSELFIYEYLKENLSFTLNLSNKLEFDLSNLDPRLLLDKSPWPFSIIIESPYLISARGINVEYLGQDEYLLNFNLNDFRKGIQLFVE